MAKYFKITKGGVSVYIKNSTRGIVDPDRNCKRLEEVLNDIETIAEGWSIVQDTTTTYHLQNWAGENKGSFTVGTIGGGDTVDLTPYLTKTLIAEIYATKESLKDYYKKSEVDPIHKAILDNMISKDLIGAGLKIGSDGKLTLDIDSNHILTFGKTKYKLSVYTENNTGELTSTEKNIIYYGSYGDATGSLKNTEAFLAAALVTYDSLISLLSQYGASKTSVTVSVPSTDSNSGLWNKSAYFVMFNKGLYTVDRFVAYSKLGTTIYTVSDGTLIKSENGGIGVYDIYYIANAGISLDNPVTVVATLKLNS